MSGRSYWLGFSSFSGIGPGKFRQLLKEFGSAEEAWKAGFVDLEGVLGKALSAKFIEFRDKFLIADYEGKLRRAKVGYLTLEDEAYPSALKEIKKPPFVLYYKGDVKFLNYSQAGGKSIAIVGTRKTTEYGRSVTESLTVDLVAQKFVTVSGLAFGVDATAHKATIDNKGKTIAVLGCGVDCCYPRENQRLYEEILDQGSVIVSEYPLGMEPSRGSFPSRNRIIAGLSQAVLVTEGGAASGALYTAEEAFALGRPVFAVPGPITSSLSKGPHSLIAKGAKLISSAKDIIRDLGLDNKGSNPLSPRLQRAKGDTKEEQKIIDLLQNEDLHFDEIARRTKTNSSKLGSILSLMEMKGMIRSLDAGFYKLSA
jgi:DNA processing protein